MSSLSSRFKGVNLHSLELSLTVLLWQASLGIFFLCLVQRYLPEQLQASAAFPGYALASYSLARFLWQAPAGWLADKFGNKRLLTIGIATGIPILVLMMGVRSGLAFLALSGLYGIAAATMWPALLSHIADTHEPERRGRAMHFLNLAQMIGLGLGTGVGVVLTDYVSFTAVFVTCLAFNLLALVMALRRRDAPPIVEPVLELAPKVERASAARLSGLRSAITPGILILGAIALFLSLGTAVQTPAIGAYTSQVLKVNFSHMAILLLIPAAIAGVLAFRMSRISDRFGRHLPLIIGLSITSVALFALTLTRSPLIAVNLVVLAGLAYNVSVPAWSAAVLDATSGHCRGLLLGVLAAIQGLGGAMGQAFGGRVTEMYGPLAPFKFAAIMLAVAILLALFYLRHQRRQCRIPSPIEP